MTIKFAPHVRHVADQQREADHEYALYRAGLTRIEAEMNMQIPPIPRDEFEDMRDLLASRHGVSA